MFVIDGCIALALTNSTENPLHNCIAPIFHGNVFMSFRVETRCDRNCSPIKVLSRGNARQMEEGWRQVDMRGHCILHVALRNTRPTNKQRHTDIFLKPTSLPGRQSVLTDMEAIVGSIDNIRIIQLVTLLKSSH